METESVQDENVWKTFIRKHWGMLALCLIGVIVAVIAAIYVFLWFVGDAQGTGLVPATLDLWTVGYIVTFLLHLIFWELVFIGIPVIIAVAVIYLLWWKQLPAEEREEYRRGKLFGKRSRSRDGGGAVTFLVNIGFVIKVYLDGNWNVPFATWTFDYLIYSYLWVIIWMVIIFGIPLAIGGTLWLRHEMKKNP